MASRGISTPLVVACVVAAVFFAYAGVLSSDFVSYDDEKYVVDNQSVRGGLTPAGIRYAWTTIDCSNWHPVTWMSLELDSTLFGSNAVGFHAVNLAWHIGNVLLLFVVLRQMTGSTWRSATVAALFALHPLHVESVAWVSERKDVLSTFFLLLTVFWYEIYAAHGGPLRYGLVVLSMGTGLLCKPMLVSLPCLLLLLDAWPLGRLRMRPCEETTDGPNRDAPDSRYRQCSITRAVLEKLPLLTLAIASSVITIVVQRTGGAVESLATLPLTIRFANSIQAYGWYLGKTFWPTNLAVFYPHPRQSLSWQGTTAALLLLVAITAYVVRARKQRPHLIVGWLWFLGSMVPTIGLLQVGLQAYADRYTYVPHIGLFIMLVWECAHVIGTCRIPKRIAATMAVAVIITCTVITKAQVAHWRDSESLMTHALEVTGENWLAHSHLGVIRLRQGRPEEAEVQLKAALRGRPNSSTAHNNLAQLLVDQEKFDEAEKHFLASLRVDRRQRRALLGLGQLREKQGRLDEAADCFRELISLRAGHWMAHYHLGAVLVKQNQTGRAIPHFQQVLKIVPDFGPAQAALKAATTINGQADDSRSQADETPETSPVVTEAVIHDSSSNTTLSPGLNARRGL